MNNPLPNPQFLKEVLKRIKNSKKSIIIVNYLVELPYKGKIRPQNASKIDVVTQIANTLIAAKKRGIEITILLEGSKFEDNYAFYKKVKEHGIDVWLDTSHTFIHHKVILIDNKIIFIGSHNLTLGSLIKNKEFSNLTNDKKTIKSFKKEFKILTKQREIIRKDVCKTGLLLPKGFIQGIASKLFKAHAENAFDLYLYLLHQSQENKNPIKINNEKWCNFLGFDAKNAGQNTTIAYKKYYYLQRCSRILYQLEKGFNLIKIDRKNDTVSCVNIKNKLKEFTSQSIIIPETFWKYKFHNKLSFRSKYFYLINLAQTKDSPFHPWWKMSRTQINKIYRFNHESQTAASNELKKHNILEVLEATPVFRSGSYRQEANYYRLNPLKKS